MAIYKKGGDLTGLQEAADAQKAVRKAAGAEARSEAGLGGAGQPRISNAMVDNSTGTPKLFEYDYYKPKDKNGKRPKVYKNELKISGGAIAAHEDKRIRIGRDEAPEKVDRDRKVSKPTGKAPVKVVREMLGKGDLTIEQAAKLNKKGTSSPIKKNK
jgi:hypothetical protein